MVMTIQPELFPFVRWSTTFATTPSPSMMRIAVPKNSARTGDMGSGVEREPTRPAERLRWARAVKAASERVVPTVDRPLLGRRVEARIANVQARAVRDEQLHRV